jgi:hypothetical protein
MVKRVVAALLWFYIAWVGWNVVAYVTGLSIFYGPVFAAAVAAFVAGDPMHRIWPARVAEDRMSGPREALTHEA